MKTLDQIKLMSDAEKARMKELNNKANKIREKYPTGLPYPSLKNLKAKGYQLLGVDIESFYKSYDYFRSIESDFIGLALNFPQTVDGVSYRMLWYSLLEEEAFVFLCSLPLLASHD